MPGGAFPVFATDDGQLLQPGGFLPAIGAAPNGTPPVEEADTGLLQGAGGFNFTLNTPAGLGGTPFGGATTHLFTVNTPNAFGIVSDSFSIVDNSPGGAGGSSANTFGGFGDFVNLTPGFLGFNIGHFISIAGQIDPLGGYVAAGVRSVFEFGFGTGAGFVPTSFFVPTPIVFGWAGGAPVVQAGQAIFGNLGNQFTFSASSVAGAILAPGATLRVRGTLTLVADPADFALSLAPLDGLNYPDIGTGLATNAEEMFRGQVAAAPEPGSLALAVLGLGAVLGIARRRK